VHDPRPGGDERRTVQRAAPDDQRVVAPGTIAPTTTASRKPPIIDKLMRPTRICLADSNRLNNSITSSR